jgi:hypothetical protein
METDLQKKARKRDGKGTKMYLKIQKNSKNKEVFDSDFGQNRLKVILVVYFTV